MKTKIIFFAVILLFIFLRFYDLEGRSLFAWDQVDSAWAAKNIIIDNNFPLVGMQARLNSGIYVGPIYYYLISTVYLFTNLDPIASPIFAGITSIFTFFTLFYVAKKLFSLNVAFMTIFLYTVSSYSIIFDRTQSLINFIPLVSFIIFYCIYKIVLGKTKYLIFLAIALGFSFHIHFTAIFFILIIFISLPFFPRSIVTLKYGIISAILFVIWLLPIIIAYFKNFQGGSPLLNYITSYYHGFHLKRVLQLTGDAFIQYEKFFALSILKYLKFFVLPIFILIYFFKNRSKERLFLVYLTTLWFLVPWLIMSTYSGEISDYYFSINMPIILVMVSYLLVKFMEIKNLVPKIIVFSLLFYYAVFNIHIFFTSNFIGLYNLRKKVLNEINMGRKIDFSQGVPESYLYYFYTEKNEDNK